MREDAVDKPFRVVAERVEEAHRQSADDLRAKVASAKARALKEMSE
jgi:formate-dependent nitrite reductase cytochrome c552 subunit